MAAGDVPKKLNREAMAELVRLAPLISIDLIIEDAEGRVLVGERNNEPAQGLWFVPGGRILKNERIEQAFERIMKEELGLDMDYHNAEFVGVFEHIYETNFAQREGFGTHYVVLAHRVKLDSKVKITADDQHSELRWVDKESLLRDKKVHPHTKAYFG